MALPFWSSFLLLTTPLTLLAAHIISPPYHILSTRQEVNTDVKYIDENTTSYNGYRLANCGTSEDVGPGLTSLLGFLIQMKPALESVIDDAKHGPGSAHGYAAFFKSGTNILKVVTAYQRLVDATPVIVSDERAKLIGTHTPQPVLQCIHTNDPQTADILKECDRLVARQQPLIPWPGTEYVSVCPSFFTLTQYPPPEQICPTLGADGRFEPGDGKLMGSGFAQAVYALIIMYNRDLHQTYENFGSVFDVRFAVALDSRQSLLNAENYGFYAEGE
ncbi:MAG: hypothetical protein Q9188_001719 [Gyalolechia gomerana]